jgi:hypothetical protein
MYGEDGSTCALCWKKTIELSWFNSVLLCKRCHDRQTKRFMLTLLQEFQEGESAF